MKCQGETGVIPGLWQHFSGIDTGSFNVEVGDWLNLAAVSRQMDKPSSRQYINNSFLSRMAVV